MHFIIVKLPGVAFKTIEWYNNIQNKYENSELSEGA